jgi:hypothetical protein
MRLQNKDLGCVGVMLRQTENQEMTVDWFLKHNLI